MMQKLLEAKGIRLSVQTVRKYMNVELHLKSATRKPRYRYHGSSDSGKVFENIINQDFTAKERYTRFCTDITYLFLADGRKRYNCTVIDLYDRAVVASVNSNRINSDLAVAALSKALEKCPETKGVIVHSDRGSQYTSSAFTEFCRSRGVVQSMSKPGYPYDNAPMERFFNTLKSELINLHRYVTEEELYEAVQMYSFGWYNNQRPHSFNNGLPPSKVA
jgi:transposase InsO family protein